MNKLLTIAAIVICFVCVFSVASIPSLEVPATPGDRKRKLHRNEWEFSEEVTTIYRIHEPDRRLHVYVLPVGQGDGHLIQCPNGDLTIVDLGTANSIRKNLGRHWNITVIQTFLEPQFHRIRNVVITHNDMDHYKLIPKVLNRSPLNVSNIYISCNSTHLHKDIKKWLNSGELTEHVRTFNNGNPCVRPDCDPLDLCPNDTRVEVLVMSANLGKCAPRSKRTNDNSIVFKVTFAGTSIMFNGDFEKGNRTSYTDKKWFAEYYNTTIFKLAHHGAKSTIEAVKNHVSNRRNPKALFVSSNPYHRNWWHPLCIIIEHFIGTRTICRPRHGGCGPHPYGSEWPRFVQSNYTCGKQAGKMIAPATTYGNELAIYTTQPDWDTINLIEIVVNRSGHWGFVNYFHSPRNNTKPARRRSG